MFGSMSWKPLNESDSNQIPVYRYPLTDLKNVDQNAHKIRYRQLKEKCIEVTFDDYIIKLLESVEHCYKRVYGFKRRRKNGTDITPNKRQFNVIQEDRNYYMNSVILEDIYFHMKKAESKNCPLFRRSAVDISIKTRSSFIDWLINITETFQLSTNMLHLVVYYTDKYLSKTDASISDLQLIGISAILLACKHEEVREKMPELDDLIKHAPNVFFKQDIMEMAQNMLVELNFKMSYSTIYQFLQIFCAICNVKGETSFLAQYLCDIALICEEIYFYTEPSKIAAASLILSDSLLGIQSKLRNIEVLSGYTQSDLKFTARLLFVKFNGILATELKAVRVKYGSTKYKNISKKDYPKSISI